MHGVRLTWANVLTLLRVALIPHLCYALWAAAWHIALSVFAFAAVTDVADGWCARWLNEETALGQYLDPIADKLLMISCYTMFTFGMSLQVAPAWFFYMILIKESLLLAGGVYVWRVRQHAALMPATIGKFAMGLQVASVTWVLWALHSHYYTATVCMYLLWAVTVSTIGALLYYTVRVLQQSGVSL